MARQIIDISTPIRNNTFDTTPADIVYIRHIESARKWCNQFGIELSDLPDGLGAANERITLLTHTGTHIDSAYHFGPMSEGKPARTTDMLELDHFFSDAFRLDFTHKKPAEKIEPGDVEAALEKIGYAIKPRDICLIHTGNDKYFNSPKYLEMQPGLTRTSVLWLVERGVKVIGIDAWGLDIPFSAMVKEVKAGVRGAFWQAHYAGKEKEYFQIEKLGQLDRIPRDHGFQVACMPVLIEGASGAWCRAAAIVED